MVGFTILLQSLQSCYCHLCVLVFDWDDRRRDLAGEGLIHTNPSMGEEIAAWRGIITLQHHSLGGGVKGTLIPGWAALPAFWRVHARIELTPLSRVERVCGKTEKRQKTKT